MKQTITLAYLLLIGLLTAACSGPATALLVTDVYSPAAPPSAQNAVIYLTITNNTAVDDTLLAAKADICTTTEIHETYEKENGLMGMRHLADGVVIEAGKTVVFESGGWHLMCLSKTDLYTAGSTFALFLTFAQTGDVQITAEIRE